MKTRRDFRLIPLVLIAVTCLAALKIAGIVLDGGYVLVETDRTPKRSWARDTLNFPGSRYANADPNDITGSVPDAKPKEDPAMKGVSDKRPEEAPAAQKAPTISSTERAVLERLQERRQELEARSREIDIRESLLKAAEKRIDARVDEIKGVETRITAATQQKEEADSTKFQSIVTMYESMKPKDAGKIFDRLEMGVLIEVASRMKPQKMSDVLAQMSTEAAERLTVELARRSGGIGMSASASALPKIEGKPSGN
jgi:flagellar motility protein MotE (MotC chaperone)